MNLKSGMGCPDWHTAMHSLWLQRLLWIYCPGHARVSGNEWASTADITTVLQLGRAEVFGGLRVFLNMDRPEHHSIDCLMEREVAKGAGDIPHSEVGNDLCSTRQTLALFRGQPWGDCWERVEHIIMVLSERCNIILSWNWNRVRFSLMNIDQTRSNEYVVYHTNTCLTVELYHLQNQCHKLPWLGVAYFATYWEWILGCFRSKLPVSWHRSNPRQ